MKKTQKRTPSASAVEMTQMALPGDANVLGSVFGGTVMAWIDIAGAIAARRHSMSSVVTASVDALVFISPILVGNIANIHAAVNWTGRTSMEVGVRVDAEDPETGKHFHTVSAYLTYVAINKKRRPVKVPPICPETEEEKRRFDNAIKRRASRLKLKNELTP